jgi:3-hydroxyisobutyrate dehydrogenase-like beta-hydroxyacid dehydrogenase
MKTVDMFGTAAKVKNSVIKLVGRRPVEKIVGFVGLGQMGLPMAHCLDRAGFTVRVYDQNPSASGKWEGPEEAVMNSLADIARASDIVILCLPGVSQLKAVVLDPDGLAASLKPGTLLVDCGTTEYGFTLDLATLVSEKGFRFLDAPVSGMAERARNGELTVMAGGNEVDFEEARPYLQAFGRNVVYMGKTGSGQLAKLINQLLFNVSLAALAEVLPLAVKLGLDPDRVEQVINTGTGQSFASRNFVPNILANRFDQGYSLEAAFKDMQSADSIMERLGYQMPVVMAASDTYQTALSKGLGKEDKGAMIKVHEEKLGVRFRSGTRNN